MVALAPPSTFSLARFPSGSGLATSTVSLDRPLRFLSLSPSVSFAFSASASFAFAFSGSFAFAFSASFSSSCWGCESTD